MGLADDARRQGLTAGHDALGARVEALRHGLEQAAQLGGHDGDVRRTVVLDQLHGGPRGELALQDERPTQRQAQLDLAEAPQVEHRRGDVVTAVVLQRDARHDRRCRHVGGRLRTARALGGAGGSGGQDNGAATTRAGRDLRLGRAGAQHLGEGRPVRVTGGVVLRLQGVSDIAGVLDVVQLGLLLIGERGSSGVLVLLPVDDDRALVEALGKQGDELLVDEEQVDLLLLHHRTGLGRGGAGVEQDDVGAELAVGAHGHEETTVVTAERCRSAGRLRTPVRW